MVDQEKALDPAKHSASMAKDSADQEDPSCLCFVSTPRCAVQRGGQLCSSAASTSAFPERTGSQPGCNLLKL